MCRSVPVQSSELLSSLCSLRKKVLTQNSRPGSKVAAAQRKLTLVNDPQAHSFSNESVECNVCKQTVDLGRQLDYDLTRWEEHKLMCR